MTAASQVSGGSGSPAIARAATTLFLRKERKRYLPPALEASLSGSVMNPASNPAAAQRLLAYGLPQAGDEAYSTVRLGDLMPRLETVPSPVQVSGDGGGQVEGGKSPMTWDWLSNYIAQATDTAGLLALAYAPGQIRTLFSLSAPKTTTTSHTEISVPFSSQGAPHQAAALAFEIGDNQSTQLGLKIEVRENELSDLGASPTPPANTLLANTFIAVHIKAHATLDLWISEPAYEAAQSLTQIVIRQEAGSRLRLHLGSVGNTLARTAVHVELAGQDAHAEILGTAALVGKRQAHRHVHVVHRMPQATSKQLFKTVATDTARSSVDGTIEVAPLAKGTVAAQTLRNLLLSETARVDSKPRLLIRNDDVKCNHGSTTGYLDDNQLFYLRSRGLTTTQATALLTGAFLHETLDVVPAGPHRDLVESVLPRLLAEVKA